MKKYSFLLLFVVTLTAFLIPFFNRSSANTLYVGAGNYYYTDVPHWESYFFSSSFIVQSPFTLIFLFLLWGIICYILWVYLNHKYIG